MYKVCWIGNTRPESTTAAPTPMVAAIDQAVIDGVDVINYSIGGTSEPGTFDDVDIAMMFAAQAGVFVATSAGNNGSGREHARQVARPRGRRRRGQHPLDRREEARPRERRRVRRFVDHRHVADRRRWSPARSPALPVRTGRRRALPARASSTRRRSPASSWSASVA